MFPKPLMLQVSSFDIFTNLVFLDCIMCNQTETDDLK